MEPKKNAHIGSTYAASHHKTYSNTQERVQYAKDRKQPLYMISVAAELCGVHPQTLRVYEQKGLVNPGRSRGNTRLYSQADIERVELIGRLTDEGINLAGVLRILDLLERANERDDEIDTLRLEVRTLRDEVHELETQIRIESVTHSNTGATQACMELLPPSVAKLLKGIIDTDTPNTEEGA